MHSTYGTQSNTSTRSYNQKSKTAESTFLHACMLACHLQGQTIHKINIAKLTTSELSPISNRMKQQVLYDTQKIRHSLLQGHMIL